MRDGKDGSYFGMSAGIQIVPCPMALGNVKWICVSMDLIYALIHFEILIIDGVKLCIPKSTSQVKLVTDAGWNWRLESIQSYLKTELKESLLRMLRIFLMPGVGTRDMAGQ